MFYAAGHWIYNWVIGWGGIGALISAALWIAWYVTPPLLGSKTPLLHAAVTATGITLASTYMSAHYYAQGRADDRAQILSQNKGASDGVRKAISNVDECENSGGDWDTVLGSCAR